MSNLKLKNINGNTSVGVGANLGADAREYSDVTFNFEANTDRNIVFAPAGGIFELRFAPFDIRGTAI